MSDGVLIAAFDSTTDQNQTLGYRELAQINARLVRKHLGLPVAVITDQPIDGFEHVILVDPPQGNTRHVVVDTVHQSYTWRNNMRTRAGELTPWDRTLMIDADCLIQTDFFALAFQSDSDFMLVKYLHELDAKDETADYIMMPNNSIPQWWATAMYWRGQAKPYFDYAHMIADNYAFYAGVFGFDPGQFRNDMVFSVVAHMLPVDPFPRTLNFAPQILNLVSADSRGLLFFDKFYMNIQRVTSDVHVVNKSVTTRRVLDMLQEYVA